MNIGSSLQYFSSLVCTLCDLTHVSILISSDPFHPALTDSRQILPWSTKSAEPITKLLAVQGVYDVVSHSYLWQWGLLI